MRGGFTTPSVTRARSTGTSSCATLPTKRNGISSARLCWMARADERVVEDDALAVAGVLRERRAAFDHAAAEDAARVVEALVLVVALGAVPLEDVDEARAVLGLVDREDAIVQLAGARGSCGT